jgi:hypothetical protein
MVLGKNNKNRWDQEMKNGHFWTHRLLAASLQFTGISGALIAMLLGSSLVPARAGTEVLGQPDAMHLRAEHASTTEVLAALAASFKLTYKLPPNINRNLNGLYSGSLRLVLARILDGTDHVVKNSDHGIEVIVLRASGMPGSTVASKAIVAPPRHPTHRPSRWAVLEVSTFPLEVVLARYEGGDGFRRHKIFGEILGLALVIRTHRNFSSHDSKQAFVRRIENARS